MLSIPPVGYAGTERVVATLVEELHRRGHKVTLFAAGDSQVDCELVPIVPQSLWSMGYRGNTLNYMALAVAAVWREHARLDVIHSHLETIAFPMARNCPTPVVSTLHGRLDNAGTPELMHEFSDIPLVAISQSQRRWFPDNNWVGTIHHGLDLAAAPFSSRVGDYLAFVGRTAPEKGIRQSIELARRVGMTLRIAAKVYDATEQAHYDEVVEPAVKEGVAEFLGELPPAQRDPLMAGARATLMLGQWPEPFGLVAIESLATGTPVIARRAGALTETIEHGIDGFLVDDLSEAALAVQLVGDLDRTKIRERALERFSPRRMVDEYEQVYVKLLEERGPRRPMTRLTAISVSPDENGESLVDERAG
jgi:glycosyltransferase involved in cell wall biosynthesis